MSDLELLQVGGSTDTEQTKESPYHAHLLPQLKNTSPSEKPDTPPPSFYATWIQNWWLLEILSLLVGAISVLAIIFILRHYDTQPAPTFNSLLGHNITLNIIISILSTIARIALLFPVAECIGQQKWFWFGSARPLTDVEVFDKGGRGAVGSLMLIWKINVRQFASVGAVILILGLAIDPLSQALLHSQLNAVPDPFGVAYVSTALTWDTYNQFDNYISSDASNDDILSQLPEPPIYMKAAILNGLLTSGSVLNDTQPFCSTGNCTWPLYRSLGVCARLQDVSTHLTKSEHRLPHYNATRWSLTNRNYLEYPEYQQCLLNMSSVAESTPADEDASVTNLVFNETIAFKDSPYPLADVFMIYANTTPNCTNADCSTAYSNRPLAFEFVLEWCVEEYSTSIVNGIVTTTRKDATNNFTGSVGNIAGPIFNTTTEFPYSRSIDTPPKYTIDHYTHYILSNYLRKVLNGSIFESSSGAITLIKSSDAAEAFWERFNTNSPEYQSGNEVRNMTGVDEILHNIAISMTNMVRQTNHTVSTGDIILPYESANGTAWREQNFVHVEWAYIAGPLCLLLLSLLFTTITIAQTIKISKSKIWKSSSLATLLALSEEIHRDVGGMRSSSENEIALQYTKALLERGLDGEWKLRGLENT